MYSLHVLYLLFFEVKLWGKHTYILTSAPQSQANKMRPLNRAPTAFVGKRPTSTNPSTHTTERYSQGCVNQLNATK